MPLKPWPYNHIKEPRPADWGIGMTVCIAAHCARDKCIVLASDLMVGTVDMSSDLMAVKMRVVGDHWIAQYAGDDISPVTPITLEVGRKMREVEDSLENLTTAFVEAYRKQLYAKVENEVLRPIGYSFEEFKSLGAAQLGSEYSRILYEVEKQRLETQFLVAGFDNGRSYIFTVDSPGKITHYSEMDFWAIGSGQTSALGSFFNSRSNPLYLDRESVLYRVCEAKFNAESALGVGTETMLVVLREDGKWRSVLRSKIDQKIRPSWQKTRALQVPVDAKTGAIEIFADFDKEIAEDAAKEQAASQAATAGQ